jgi:glycosyltransferase involved in cell wall biosynthesis
MRVVHVVPGISEESSGPTYSVRRLCESLIARQHDLILATLAWNSSVELSGFIKAFPIGSGPMRLGRSPSMYRWLADRCAMGAVDILHNHGMWQMNSVYPAWAAKRGNVQLVYSPRGAFSEWAMENGSIAKKIFWPLFQLPALRHATCFHATADSEYEDIRRLGFRQPIAIIPNGVDLHDLPTRTSGPQRTLLFLGRIHPKKGLDTLLSAWRLVQEHFPDWKLVIAGSDHGYYGSSGYLDKLKAEVLFSELKRVEFPGPLHGPEKLLAYRNADIFVLPTHSENFAMTVAEALSMGTPALVSKGAPWSGLEANDAGWWVDIGPGPLAGCLMNAMSQPRELLTSMGDRGRAWMQRDFSWDGIGLRMSEIYRWLHDRTLPVPAWVRLD